MTEPTGSISFRCSATSSATSLIPQSCAMNTTSKSAFARTKESKRVQEGYSAMHWPTNSLGCGALAWRGAGCGGCWRMGHGRAKAGVSGGLGCARPGHVRPTGGQSSERVGAPEAHKQATNPSRARPRFLRMSDRVRMSRSSQNERSSRAKRKKRLNVSC